MTGHLFVVDGDITRLACDAVLVPTDQSWWVETPAFAELLAMSSTGPVENHPDAWPETGVWLAHHGRRTRSGSVTTPDVWVGDIGRSVDSDFDHYAARARAFVREAAPIARERLQRRRLTRGRRPLLCLNVLGSGAGGKRSERGRLLGALVPALMEAATRENADVVLVCFGRTMYAAAQATRRRILGELGPDAGGWSDCDEEMRSAGDSLAESARSGRLVLFMGAGVSVDAGIPAWKPLLETLARDLLKLDRAELSSLAGLDPRDQALLIERGAEPEALRKGLKRLMQTTRHGLAHALLASLPSTETVTTNFDELFESACSAARQPLSVIPGGEVIPGERWLLKLHGTLGGDVVFTRSDYLSATSTHAALRGIVQAMLLTRHMLFVGYSLSDEDFHQLVHEVRKARGENASSFGTALFPQSNPHLQEIWRDLNIVSPSDPALDFTERVRRLWILLDWIGMWASSQVAHLADDSFGEMRTDDENELSDIVGRLRRLRSRVSDSPGSGWQELDHFLSRFGHHSD